MGVMAPRSVHARLNINGKLSGVYALTEQIDSQFIDYNFQEKTGNLYKEVWPIDFKGNIQTDQLSQLSFRNLKLVKLTTTKNCPKTNNMGKKTVRKQPIWTKNCLKTTNMDQKLCENNQY